MYLEWNETYSTGDTTLDQQHKYIIGVINALRIENQKGTAQGEDLVRLMTKLAVLAYIHFRFEENLLLTAGFQRMDWLKAEHRGLFNQAETLRHALDSGHRVEPRMVTLLCYSFYNHITSEREFHPLLWSRPPSRRSPYQFAF